MTYQDPRKLYLRPDGVSELVPDHALARSFPVHPLPKADPFNWTLALFMGAGFFGLMMWAVFQ